MKFWYQYLFILLSFIIYFRSTTAYPSSYGQGQRGFLLCQLSAVSCKRSLLNTDEIEKSLKMNLNDHFKMCIDSNKPLWFCLDPPLNYRMK